MAGDMTNSEPTSNVLAEVEINQIADNLSRIPAGFLPFPLFRQVARLATMSIIEIVPYRIRDGRVEIWLTEHGVENQPWPELWPDTLHTPGTVIRPTDESYQDAIDRVLKDELQGVELAGVPEYVCNILHRNRRGLENAQVFVAEVLGNLAVGDFYPADSLPDNLMRCQHDFMPQAIEKIRQLSIAQLASTATR